MRVLIFGRPVADYLAFVRTRVPEIISYAAPVVKEEGPVVYDDLQSSPDPVRYGDFAFAGEHPAAQLFSSFAPFAQFGDWSAEAFGGKLGSPEPLAWTPHGALAVDEPRRVVPRPPARGMGS